MTNKRSTIYSQISAEYYDSGAHPTCSDLRNACRVGLRGLLPQFDRGQALEVGCGASLVCEVANSSDWTPGAIHITDASVGMISHSRPFNSKDVYGVVSDVERLPYRDETFETVFSILGDPYNYVDAWLEVNRVLVPNGKFLYICPSFHWSSRFRSHSENEEEEDRALFVTTQGKKLYVPSFIYSKERQTEIFSMSGFVVREVSSVNKSEIDRIYSNKIQDVLGCGDAIIDIYVLIKR